MSPDIQHNPPAHPKHMRLSANARGRDFFLGDLHGMLDDLHRAMEAVAFDPSVDRVLSVGDLIDRGPSVVPVLALLDEPWFFTVQGNHEAMMVSAEEGPEARQFWIRNGGHWIHGASEAEEQRYRRVCADLPLALTLELPDGRLAGVCHAEFPDEDWRRVDATLTDPIKRDHMLWGRRQIRTGAARQDQGAVLTVHGHTPIDMPRRLGSALFIDTGCVYGGALTLISAEEALVMPDYTL